MVQTGISPVVAPDMGDFQSGIESFKQTKPPYARGGNTPASKELEWNVLAYVGATDAPAEDYEHFSVGLVSSGQAANHVAFKAFGGSDIVSTKHLFGTTKTDLTMSFKSAGGNIAYVSPYDVQAFIDNTNENTTAWFVEAISNPAGYVPEFKDLRKAADEHGVALIVDATLAAGMEKFNAYEYADVITVSLTKQAGGGDNENAGGAILVNEKFDWQKMADRLPEFKHYFGENVPEKPFSALCSKISLHEGSGLIPPQVALSIAEALPDMEYRVRRMSENARALAGQMAMHDAIESVKLAGFSTDPENDRRTREYMGENHFVILFDLKKGFDAAAKFINSGQFLHAVALGQKTTAVSNPASSTHRQYSAEDLSKMGIQPGTIRMSVGTEDVQDLERKLYKAIAGIPADADPSDTVSISQGFEDAPFDGYATFRHETGIPKDLMSSIIQDHAEYLIEKAQPKI